MTASRRGIVKWMSLLLVVALLAGACVPIQPLPAEGAAAPAPAPDADPLAGDWSGAIQVAGIALAIALHLVADGSGGYSATLDIPQQGAAGLPVGNLSVEGDTLLFTILDGAQQATFSGVLEGDAITGAFSQAGQEGSFTLARAAAVAGSTEEPAAGATGIDSTFTNAAGAFSVPVPTGFTVSEENGIVTLLGPEAGMTVHIVAVPSADVEAAIDAAWQQVDPTFDLEILQTVEPPASAGYERILVHTYDTGGNARIVQVAGLLYSGVTYVMIYDLSLEAVQRRSAQIQIIDSGFKVLAMDQETLAPEDMAELTPELIAEWEAFITDTLATFEVPGAVVGLVQGGELVYANGFGYADLAAQTPMTADTHMMIGSTGKSLTTMMMATLVDDGLMTWDTPARDLFPSFTVKDPALSETITMRNLVCACTGVPRRDFEFLFNFSSLDADAVIASLADFEFFTDFGEAFQYSNQMVATAGYIAGHVAQPDIADLAEAYAAALAERVTGPLGMTNTTMSFADVEARGQYATPHGLLLTGGVGPISLEIERSLEPIGPAGAHWSTLNDMARYMVAQLNPGVAADGTRVVSEQNLLVTRLPQVQISADTAYGLGWMVGAWRGLPMIEHGGNTLGFTSDFSFLPTADLGIILLTNAQAANSATGAIRLFLLQRLFGVDETAAAMVTFMRQQMDDSQARLDERIAGALDPAEVEPFVGAYTNAALGDLTLTLDDGGAVANFGEIVSAIVPFNTQEGARDGFILADPPVPGLALRLIMDGETPTLVLGEGLTAYTFTPVE